MRAIQMFLVTLAVMTASAANAALPEGVTDALTAAQADGVTFAGLVLVAIIAIWAFKLIRQGK